METTELIRYFMKRTEEDFKLLNKRIGAFEEKLNDVWAFKLKTLGVIAATSTIFSVIVSLITLYLKTK